MLPTCQRCRGKNGKPVGEYIVNASESPATYCARCRDKVAAAHEVSPVGDSPMPNDDEVPAPAQKPSASDLSGLVDDSDENPANDDEKTSDDSDEPKVKLTYQHLGGGWFILSDGRKIKGKVAAEMEGAVRA